MSGDLELTVTPKTGDVLIQMGVLTPAQLEISLVQQRSMSAAGKRMHIGELLVRNQFARRDQIALAVERITGGGKVASYQTLLDPKLCVRFAVIPVRTEDEMLYVMTGRALKPFEIESIRKACTVEVIGVRQIAVSKASITERLGTLTSGEIGFAAAIHRMQQLDTGNALREAVNILLQDALEMRASDIHLDHKPNPDSWVSYRVDGVMVQKHLLDHRMMGAVCTRLKSEAGMDASNNINPQDGRVSIEHQGRNIDFRVNSQPLVDGQTLALRVLDSEALPTTDQMFPNQLVMSDLFSTIAKSNGKRGGIFLATGPTGSGKTTTLYALAKMLPRDSKTIFTVENPVEYRLPFARQIQLNALLGQQAGDMERSLLRQDPDQIILGEIRDKDTASAALKLAESGHLVLATLHSDDVVSTFERMTGFFHGAEKDEALYVLGQQLRCCINQQLIPRLCSCATVTPKAKQDAQAAELGLEILTPTRTRYGCAKCSKGIRGRVLAHETIILPRDREVRSKIHAILKDGVNGAAVLKVPGVNYISREHVVVRLLEAGQIDLEEAKNILLN